MSNTSVNPGHVNELQHIDAGQEMTLPVQGRKKLAIVVPYYNEEENVSASTAQLNAFAEKIKGSYDVEVICVDDHSADRTPFLLRDACAQYENFRYYRLSANRGAHIAIICGLTHSNSDCAVFMAGDMQDPPELILKMLDLWHKGNHVVWAVRESIEGVSRTNKFLSRMFYRIINKIGTVRLPPSGADFALLDSSAVSALLRSTGSTPSLGGIIASLGFRSASVLYTKEQRRFGRSKWTLGKKMQASLDALVAFSFAPMRLMIYLGVTCAILGFLYAFLIIIFNIAGFHPLSGWSSLMVAILVLSGIQMFMLGILGEYLWRNLEEARKKPLYFIEESSVQQKQLS